ncbi:LuxR C-terminal-related transcriptional regulator [Paenibacillus filicis]|uniref:LuxR C-terminal-related transcriptional regulator n=1 Tax=Paenibacillus filicis TaxID=669464 RepID=A0ABU9DD35_9BACL
MKAVNDPILLSTKLKMPAPRKRYIVRHELFAHLQRACEMKVIYVMGAAGMGKTSLLSSYIRENGLTEAAWLSLDEANDNLISFWHYWIAAASPFLGDDRDEILSLLRSHIEASSIERVLTHVINRLGGDQPYYLVLDDIHCIQNQELIDSIDYFLRSMPDNLHLVMLSREQPRFYFGEMAASGQFLLLDGHQLRFSAEEGLRFLKETLQLQASEEALRQMNDLAEGWIGGLQLVAAAGGVDRGLLRGAGSEITAQYLTREIFRLLSGEERRFLTVSCILTYWDQELCASLLPETDFPAMVGKLISQNLFIVCVDEDKGIYRYHPILGDYLVQQFAALPGDMQVQLHQAAARVLASRREHEEALRHLWAIRDYDGVKTLLRTMSETVETWMHIDRLPLQELVSDRNLAIQCLMFNLSNLRLSRTEEIGRAIQERYGDEEVSRGLYYLYPYIHGSLDRLHPQPVPLTLEQIEGLGLSPVTEALLLIVSSNVLLEERRYRESEKFAGRALERGCRGNVYMTFFGLSSKAQLMEEAGRLYDSLAVYARMEALLSSSPLTKSLGYNYYVGTLGVYHKQMDEENARKTLDAIRLILSEEEMPPLAVQVGYDYHQAEYDLLFGDGEQGAAIVSRMVEGGFADDLLHLDRLLTAMYARGRLSAELAERFVEAFRLQGEQRASLAALQLFAGLAGDRGEFDEALRQTESVLSFSRAHQNRLRLVEASLLKIRLLSLSGTAQERTVHNSLREAIYYAYEHRILQPFFLERSVLTPWLEPYARSAAAQLNDGERGFVQLALKLCSGENRTAENSREQLSARELEVLAELAKGLTNPEIAERLCISLATVKTHVIHIYGKLEVSTRLAAVQEAARRGLIRRFP